MDMYSHSSKLAELKKKAGAKTSGKTPTSGHDPAGKKTGATAKKMGSTYDYRKGSKAKDPRKEAAAKRSAARDIKRAVRKKRAAEKKAARVAKRDAKKKARLAKKTAKGKK